MRGQILGSAGTANAGRASPAPTVKSRNSAYNHARTLAAHCRGGALLHPKSLAAPQGLSGRAMLAPYDRITKERYIFVKTLPFTRRGLHRRPAEGASNFWHSCGPPIRAKTFFYSQKRAPDPEIGGFFGAPSAGAFRKQCSALFLATGPREANASRTAAQHEPAP